MKILLDSHSFLWFVWADSRLSSTANSAIRDPANFKLLSIASVWEIAIKSGNGKLQLGAPADQFVRREIKRNNFTLLDISISHAAAVESLPQHHKDPFDRILAVQCLLENLTIVSIDAIFDAYGVPRIW